MCPDENLQLNNEIEAMEFTLRRTRFIGEREYGRLRGVIFLIPSGRIYGAIRDWFFWIAHRRTAIRTLGEGILRKIP